MICCLAFYLICLHFDMSRKAAVLSSLPLLFVSLLLIKGDLISENIFRQVSLFVIAMVGIINVAFWHFSFDEGNYISSCLSNKDILKKWQNNEADVIKALSDLPYIRYTGSNIETNANINSRISNTQYYWSLSNPYTGNFRDLLQLRDHKSFYYEDYDDRTTLNELSAVRYYTAKNGKNNSMPYGYELIGDADVRESKRTELFEELKKELGVSALTEGQIENINDEISPKEYYVYENRFALPIGYCYDNYISKDRWDSLNPVQKQEIELSAVYTDISPDALNLYTGDIEEYTIPYEIECKSNDISQVDSGFVATDSETNIEITFNGAENNSETYIGFEGLQFTETPKYDLYFGEDTVDPLRLYNKTNWEMLSEAEKQDIHKDKLNGILLGGVNITVETEDGVNKGITFWPPDASFSSGRQDYIVNLGYRDEPIKSVTITFPKRGVYTYSSMRVYNVPMRGYEEKAEVLKSNSLQNIKMDTDTISGELDIEGDKILCVAIPYSTGWKGFIDENETETFCANARYIGMIVPAGRHNIRLTYNAPYKTEGFILTIAGFTALGIICFLRRRKLLNSIGVIYPHN